MKDLLKSIMKKFDSEVLSEESRTEIEASLSSIVEDKVAAEKVLYSEEQSGLYESAIESKIKEVVEGAEEWKKEVLSKVETASKELDTEIEEKLKVEMENCQSNMVEKVSDFLNYKLDEKIDDEKLVDAGKLRIFEPIVQGVLNIMKENYVDMEEDSFELLKKAKAEIDSVESKLAEKVKENMKLCNEISDSKKEEKLTAVLEGLTPDQTSKARLILEDTSADEVEAKWENVKDVILGEDTENEDVDDSEENSEIDTEGDEDTDAPNEELTEMQGYVKLYKDNIKRD